MLAGVCGPRKLRETVLKIAAPHGAWLLAAPPCACTVEELVRALAADGDCDGATLERVRRALSGRVVEAAAAPAAAAPVFEILSSEFGAPPAEAVAVPRKPAARRAPAARQAPAASVTQQLVPRQPPARRRAAPAPAPAPADVRSAFTKKTRAALKKMTRIIDDFADLAGYDELGYDDPGFRAAKRVSDALDAKRLADALDALELSVGKRAQRPVPDPEAFAGAGGVASSSSRRAPPSGNRRPRRRARMDSDQL